MSFGKVLESQVEVLSFRRINVKKDGNSIPSRFAESPYFASFFYNKISIFKVLLDAQPSV